MHYGTFNSSSGRLPQIGEDPSVKEAMGAYRADKNPRTLHRLESALTEAGVKKPVERKRVIDRLLKCRRWGEG